MHVCPNSDTRKLVSDMGPSKSGEHGDNLHVVRCLAIHSVRGSRLRASRRPDWLSCGIIKGSMKSAIRNLSSWLSMLLVAAPLGSAADPAPREYRLRFNHTHTNERLDIVYKIG